MSDPDDHWDEAMANDGDRFDDEEEFDEDDYNFDHDD